MRTGCWTVIAQLADDAPAVVVSVPGNGRALDDLVAVLERAGMPPTFAGYTVDDSRGRREPTTLAVIEPPADRVATTPPSDFRVTAVLPVFNEADIVEAAITKLVDGGVDVVLVDNWSTDDTVARAQALGLGERLTLERFPPSGPTGTFDWQDLLHNSEAIAERRGGWITHQDVDEVRQRSLAGARAARRPLAGAPPRDTTR